MVECGVDEGVFEAVISLSRHTFVWFWFALVWLFFSWLVFFFLSWHHHVTAQHQHHETII